MVSIRKITLVELRNDWILLRVLVVLWLFRSSCSIWFHSVVQRQIRFAIVFFMASRYPAFVALNLKAIRVCCRYHFFCRAETDWFFFGRRISWDGVSLSLRDTSPRRPPTTRRRRSRGVSSVTFHFFHRIFVHFLADAAARLVIEWIKRR